MEKWKNNRTIKIGKKGFSKEYALVTIFSFILFSSLFSYPEVYSDVFDFDEPKNISVTPGSSQTPQIATLESNVYIVWTEIDESGNFEIFFTRSDDDGVTFPFDINNLSNSPDFSYSQQITAAGENVYVVWQDENSGNQDIFFTRSDDNGGTFNGGIPGFPGTPINLSNNPDFSNFPQIASMDNNVYIVWVDGTFGDEGILFSASHNNGDTFVIEKENLSSSTGIPQFPQIAIAGDNVYVVWQDFNFLDVPPTFDVFFSKINDNGLIFSEGLNLNELAFSSSNPQVAAVGDNVYIVWESAGDEGNEIFFSASHNNGDTFVVEKENLRPSSSTSFPQLTQIAAAGDNVYVVWQEDDLDSGFSDIFIRASNNGGLSFGDPINLSDNLSFSIIPQIAAVDENVFVVWVDDVSSIYDVFFASSTNGGGLFQTKILSTPDSSLFPQIEVGSAHVIWQETTDNDEIFYNRGIETPTSLTFDNLNYKLSDTATITLTGVPGPGPKSVTIFSSADPLGFPLDLIEIETVPGTYTGTITFTTDSSDPLGILRVKFGGSIHADFEGIDVSANIFPRTVLSLEEYTLSSFVQVTVEDQNSNKKPLVPEIITVNIKSDTDQTGISLDLKETEEDSGIFVNKNLIFMTGRDFFSLGDKVTIVQEEADSEFITDNTINVEVRSTLDSDGIPNFVLTETGPDTDLFEGTLEFTSGETSGNAIQVADGDIISVEYRDEIANGLIIPNPDSTVGAIEAAIGDTITVTYLGTSDTAKIVDSSGSVGRGGGGFIRPGLVLNFLDPFGGSSSGGKSSTFGSSSFATIIGGEEGFGGIISDNDLNTFEETKTFKVGEKAVLRFDFTEGGGIGKIEHIGLYTNVRDGQKRQDSDAYIYYDPLKSPPVTVHDPNGLFSEANFELLQMDVTKFVLKYDLTFAKPMAKSDLILESWNLKKWSSINKIPNAIEVISSGIVQEAQSEPVKTFLEDVTDDQVIPVWVKSNAKWWSDDEIDNENFISGIEYLVNEGIIKVSLTDTTDTSISEIPTWIKNNAGWWAEEM
ncbi:MAG TPA: hypothetical protein VJJ01_02100, partial [Nitrosopumilaceae archaeon]|nr:hypothetical protein [Nitrosopumilaceae archaeon]